MVFFILGILIDESIYHCDRNEETKPMVVSVVKMVAGIGWAGVAPPNRAVRLGSKVQR